MDQPLKRISLLVREDQYESLTARGLNVSGLVRDLIDDHLSAHRVTVNVSEETRALYDKIVANTGLTDADLEKYLRRALSEVLKDRIALMQSLADAALKE